MRYNYHLGQLSFASLPGREIVYQLEVVISPAVGKFYSQFNNIMAVLGKQDNEMVAVHLMQSYCLSSLLYACLLYTSDAADE